MAKPIEFYYDLLSQPSRALYILLKINNVPFEDHPVALRKGAHLTNEFKDINRFQRVPCIVDNGFKLSESIAISRYLQTKGSLTEKWYPTEILSKARTDEYLEWQHNNTRGACAKYFQLKWLLPLRTGKETSPDRLASVQKVMEKILDTIENTWLANTKFLTGDTVNIADIFGACEIEQIRIAGYDPGQGRPKLNAWLKAVRNTTEPYYSEAHQLVDKLSQTNSKL